MAMHYNPMEVVSRLDSADRVRLTEASFEVVLFDACVLLYNSSC